MEREIVKEVLDEIGIAYSSGRGGFFRFDEYCSEISARLTEKYPDYGELITRAINVTKAELDKRNINVTTGVFSIGSDLKSELEEAIFEQLNTVRRQAS